MVQVVEPNNDWANAFRQLGAGFTEGYMNRADEMAIRNAIAGLGEKASARDILNALTNTNTYRSEAKQNALKNYIGVEQFEELKRQHQASEERNIRKDELDKIKAEADLAKDKIKEKYDEKRLQISEEKNELAKQRLAHDLRVEEAKEMEKIAPFKTALNSIGEMEEILDKNSLGRGSDVISFFSNATAKDKGKYKKLGASLIALSTTIPIRNKAEFEAAAEGLQDTTRPIAEMRGSLEALKSILLKNLEEQQQISNKLTGKDIANPEEPKQKKPLGAFRIKNG